MIICEATNSSEMGGKPEEIYKIIGTKREIASVEVSKFNSPKKTTKLSPPPMGNTNDNVIVLGKRGLERVKAEPKKNKVELNDQGEVVS